MTSTRGSGKTGGFYAGANRALPGERGQRAGQFVFADGHGQSFTRSELDDFDHDGTDDNGYYNGHGDPNFQ